MFSYYEFWSGSRLTDDEWAKMIGFAEDENYGFLMYQGPPYRMVDMMPWTKDYVSTEPNNVTTEMIELTWGD